MRDTSGIKKNALSLEGKKRMINVCVGMLVAFRPDRQWPHNAFPLNSFQTDFFFFFSEIAQLYHFLIVILFVLFNFETQPLCDDGQPEENVIKSFT